MFYEFQHFGLSEYFSKEYGVDFNFPAHLHQSFELITVISGEMEVAVDNSVYSICPGEAVLVFPNQLHSLSSRSCEHMLCIFSPEIVKSFFAKTSNKIPRSNKFRISDYLLSGVDSLCDTSSVIKKKGVLYSVCSAFDDSAEYTDKKSADTNLLYRIFEFVETNYNKDCTLEKLSEATSFSYSYLSRYFKSTVKMSFNSYVNQYRISKACYMLNNSDCTVLRCALECGYTSLRSFNRNFKLCTSMTPRQYRAN